MKRDLCLAAVLAVAVSGCASVIDGTSQPMTVATNPEGAECRLMRNGELLSRVTTPQTINIKKTKHDINIECELEGFHKSTEHVKSEIQDATWGNIILGGGIGWAVDSASGADNKYKEHVTITMVPLGQPKSEMAMTASEEGATADDSADPEAEMESDAAEPPAETSVEEVSSVEAATPDDTPAAALPTDANDDDIEAQAEEDMAEEESVSDAQIETQTDTLSQGASGTGSQ